MYMKMISKSDLTVHNDYYGFSSDDSHMTQDGGNFKPQCQTLTSSRSATAVGNSFSQQAKVLGMANLHLSESYGRQNHFVHRQRLQNITCTLRVPLSLQCHCTQDK